MSTVRIRRTPLTPIELRVLRGASEGKTASEQGRELRIAAETVKTHRRHVLFKLDARNMTHAVALAYENGLLWRRAAEEEVTGPQIGAFKKMRDDLAALRRADKSEIEREALAAASLRLGREITSIKDHSRREAYDTLDWLDEQIKVASTAATIREHATA